MELISTHITFDARLDLESEAFCVKYCTQHKNYELQKWDNLSGRKTLTVTINMLRNA